MWALAVVVFVVCKLVTWLPFAERMSARATAAYLFGWPGLNVSPFTRCERRARYAAQWSEWAWASGKTLFGTGLIWGMVRLVPHKSPLLAAWVGIVGLGFILHFGTFHLLGLVWRAAGYDVQPLMKAPHRATSLVDFWSRRWNLAFRDLSHLFILKPLRQRLGVNGAMLAVFLFSGLVHDFVISLPAKGGYGLPTAYFLLQAIGMMAQRTRFARSSHLNHGVGGWVMTAAFVMGPLPLLFHQPFLIRVVLPFLTAVGAR